MAHLLKFCQEPMFRDSSTETSYCTACIYCTTATESCNMWQLTITYCQTQAINYKPPCITWPHTHQRNHSPAPHSLIRATSSRSSQLDPPSHVSVSLSVKHNPARFSASEVGWSRSSFGTYTRLELVLVGVCLSPFQLPEVLHSILAHSVMTNHAAYPIWLPASLIRIYN